MLAEVESFGASTAGLRSGAPGPGAAAAKARRGKADLWRRTPADPPSGTPGVSTGGPSPAVPRPTS